MARHRTQSNVTRSFLNALNVAGKLYGPVAPECVYTADTFDEYSFHPLVASKAVGLAFLSAVAAWEEFVEESFLRYMCGAAAENGCSPILTLGPCRNRAHALAVLTAPFGVSVGSRNLQWHDFKWVQHVAKVFFRRGEPYSLVQPRLIELLNDAVVIRNRVAHNSAKARKAFKRIANRMLGCTETAPLPKGFSPGRLLVSTNLPKADQVLVDAELLFEWDCLFEAYINIYEHLAFHVTPYPIQSAVAAFDGSKASPTIS
jgi:hypothetical protein